MFTRRPHSRVAGPKVVAAVGARPAAVEGSVMWSERPLAAKGDSPTSEVLEQSSCSDQQLRPVRPQKADRGVAIEHFMSRQTFEHITLECHSVCLHIKMFGKQCPSQPTDLEESGSDECEKTFRSFGGFSRSGGRRRNYNFLEALDAAGDENC